MKYIAGISLIAAENILMPIEKSNSVMKQLIISGYASPPEYGERKEYTI